MHRIRRRIRTHANRLIAVGLIVGMLAATVGVPVFNPRMGANGKDLSQPFPCQHSQCGCQNAEACWRGCCCHSEREKLAWADAHRIQAPDYVVAAAAKEQLPEPNPASCCCQAKRDTNHAHTPVWIFSVAARKCQGLGQLYLLLTTALPASAPVDVALRAVESGSVELSREPLVSHSSSPGTPPPRA